MRYRRHHVTASGSASPAIEKEFPGQFCEEQAHADRVAGRISELGDDPDFNSVRLQGRSDAGHGVSRDIQARLRANFVAERVAVATNWQRMKLSDDVPMKRKCLEDFLADEKEQATELKEML